VRLTGDVPFDEVCPNEDLSRSDRTRWRRWSSCTGATSLKTALDDGLSSEEPKRIVEEGR